MRLEPRTPGLQVKHLTTEPRGTRKKEELDVRVIIVVVVEALVAAAEVVVNTSVATTMLR